MFDFSFAEFDIIACFLMQPLMERFGTKLKKECRPGTNRLFQQPFTFPGEKRGRK